MYVSASAVVFYGGRLSEPFIERLAEPGDYIGTAGNKNVGPASVPSFFLVRIRTEVKRNNSYYTNLHFRCRKFFP